MHALKGHWKIYDASCSVTMKNRNGCVLFYVSVLTSFEKLWDESYKQIHFEGKIVRQSHFLQRLMDLHAKRYVD